MGNKEELKVIRVGESYHQQAKQNSVADKITLQKYVELLIAWDSAERAAEATEKELASQSEGKEKTAQCL